MIANRNLVTCLHNQNVSDSAKILWLLINSEEKDPDGFVYLSQTDWADKYSFSVPKLKKNLKSLNDQHLIVRNYRSDSGCGKKLYVKPLPPETEDDMTFFGEFDCIEEIVHEKLGLTRCAWFKHVANTNRSIKQPIIQVVLKPNCLNSQALEHMEKGDLIVFKATVIRGDKGFYFKNIHNIIPREEFYNNNFIENTND
jgi:hypothetical protein